MAIWMFNEIVERYPEVYIFLKKQYMRKYNEKVNNINDNE
jgi:hypothetical protein